MDWITNIFTLLIVILTYVWLPKENKSEIDNFFLACIKAIQYLIWDLEYRNWVLNIRFMHTQWLNNFKQYKLNFYNRYNNQWLKRRVSLSRLIIVTLLLVWMLLVVVFQF